MGTIASYTDVLYGPLYSAFGVNCTYLLAPPLNVPIDIVTIDKTSGVEVAEGNIEIQTVRPAAIIRLADLTALGYVPEDLLDAVCSLNGVSWEVKSYFPKPSPNGEQDGELYLLLTEAP